jgi:5-methyltetrahydropteroyltriglutamate--homocysteine methyltransferase
MSQLLAASIGSYPRTGEDKDQQRYPRATGHFERKEISAHALRDVEQSVAQELIREQLDAGVDEATDGLIAWPDPISRFTRHLSSTRMSGLARYFDNNFYYRIPVITAKPKIGPPISPAEFRFARDISNKPIRAILTGPLTLALHTTATAKGLDRLPALVEFFTDVIAQEVAALAAENAPVIQIDEPSLVAHPEHLPFFKEAAAKLAAVKGKSKLALALFFGSSAPLVDALKDLPFDVWHIDIVKDRSDMLLKLAGAPKTVAVGLGILDGRSTLLESTDSVAAALNGWLGERSGAVHYLSASCGLELLPRKSAGAKLRRLAEIRRQLDGLTVGVPRA